MTVRMHPRLKAALELAPVWYLWFQALSLLDIQVRLLDPPRYDLAPTAAFPLAWFAAYYLVKPAQSPARTWQRATLLVTLSCALPLVLMLVVFDPAPRPPEVLMRQMELSRLFLTAMLGLHCLRFVSRAAFVKFFGVGLLYGAILESGGIMGGFFSEPGYLLYIPGVPAPVVNIVGWCVTLYLSVYVWQSILDRFEPRRFKPAIFALGVTAIALCQDLQIDPYATQYAWWIWHESLPPFFLGVPLLNFLAWIAAVLPFAWLYYHTERIPGLTDTRRIVRLFLAIPIMLVAALAIVLLLTLAFRGPRSPDIEMFATALRLKTGGG